MNGGVISDNVGGLDATVVVEGTFTMTGGVISNNEAPRAVVMVSGTFNMEGGEISGNSSSAGVLVNGAGIFNMYDGEISGHTNGRGVSDLGGTFTMHDGTISGNTGAHTGGGVDSFGNFTMYGGKIFGNTAGSNGGGVRASGTFTMHGGEIFGNTAGSIGGGMWASGTFTMHGGEIFGNTAGSDGGGMSVSGGAIRIVSGIIRGNEAGAGLANTATNNGASLNGTARIGTFDNGQFAETGTVSTADVTLHVVNGVVQEIDGDFIVQLAWLRAFAQGGGRYTVELSGDKTIAPISLPTGRTDLTITLRSTGEMRTVGLSDSGNLFWVPSGVTLVLDENITLQGRDGNISRLVVVNGTLIMNEGSRVTGNIGGGGVQVNSGGTLVLDGGVISGNSTTGTGAAGNGGGVRLEGGGTLRISNGIIHGSDAAEHLRNTASGSGAALFVTAPLPSVSGGTAQFGTFDDGGVFTELGELSTTNLTIEVVNGVLQGMEGSLAEQLAWLRNFAQIGGTYTIELGDDEVIVPCSSSYTSWQETLPTGRTDLTIILRGTTEMRTVNLSANGNLFRVPSGVTLVLDENVTLMGRSNNNHLVRVNDGGTLIMNEGSRITGNTNGSGGTNAGGGVRVNSGGMFILDGGKISNNRAHQGGGVFVDSNGTFRISDGIIHGSDAAEGLANTATGNGAALLGTARFGTFDNAGEFTESGEISTSNLTIEVEDGELLRPLPQA